LQPALTIQPGQQTLTLEQKAEVKRFALARIQNQLAIEPVDEQEAEAFLRQIYRVAREEDPAQVLWLDSPLQLVPLALSPSIWSSVSDRVAARVWASIRDSLADDVLDEVGTIVWNRVRSSVGVLVGASVKESVEERTWDSVTARIGASLWDSTGVGVKSFHDAAWLSFYYFFNVYLTPNDLQALARFNEMVSGYWLGREKAVIVRRPRVLERDAAGRLHSATGKCVEYRDGWGFYAWHGVRVSEKVILTPERLNSEDFLAAPNVEVRRIVQERMGERFVPALGGVVIDQGPRGTLYEVSLPGDPERVARYVQVQDASTSRGYFLRVPPTMQTAAEAVAWSFACTVEEYQPAHET
jgi:hypothetical protein